MCWAYYPKLGINEKPEPLGIHLVGVAESILKHPDFKRINKKINKMYNIDIKEAQDIVFLIGLLHDIGKAYIKYQKEPENGFSKHEFYSAFIVHYILLIRGEDETIKSLITYPIMLHHYAQRYNITNAYRSALNELGVKNGSLTLPIQKQCLRDIDEVLTYGKSIVVSELGKEIINELMNEVNNMFFYLYPFGNDPLKPLQSIIQQDRWFGISALTGILNEADGKVAIINRRGKV